MRKLFTIILAAIPTLLLAHHSFEAEFDRTKQVTLTGTITKFEWMNPHIWIYMDVKTADGKVAKYQFEGGAPNMLKRNGWSRTSLKEGDTATIVGALSKDGTNTVNATSVTLADGTKVLAECSDTKTAVK